MIKIIALMVLVGLVATCIYQKLMSAMVQRSSGAWPALTTKTIVLGLWQRMRPVMLYAVSVLDGVGKMSLGIISILGILEFLLPGKIWSIYEAKLLSRMGISGMIYYSVGENRAVTDGGQLYLMKGGTSAAFEDLEVGDKLQAVSEKWIYDSTNFNLGVFSDDQCNYIGKKRSKMFHVKSGQCMIVTEINKTMALDEKYLECEYNKNSTQVRAISGGWVKVSMASCWKKFMASEQ